MKKHYVIGFGDLSIPDFISFIEDNKSPNMMSSNDNFPFVVDWQMFESVVEQLSDTSAIYISMAE
jgi:hypothetical protein